MESVLTSNENFSGSSSDMDIHFLNNHNLFEEAFIILKEEQNFVTLTYARAKHHMRDLLDRITDNKQKQRDDKVVGLALGAVKAEIKDLLAEIDYKLKQVEIEAPSVHDEIVSKTKVSSRWKKGIRRFGGRVLAAFKACG